MYYLSMCVYPPRQHSVACVRFGNPRNKEQRKKHTHIYRENCDKSQHQAATATPNIAIVSA